MAVLRRVSRSFGHRLRLRALHLDTLLRTADSAPARKGRMWLSAGGVKSHRHRVPLKTGGSGADQQMESGLTYITRPAAGAAHDAAQIVRICTTGNLFELDDTAVQIGGTARGY